MAQTPSGTTLWIATQFGTAVPFTAISNAPEAVVDAEVPDAEVGDMVEVTSKWGRVNKRFYRIKAITTSPNKITLERCNTVSERFFPPGGGAGSLRLVTERTQITQVLGITGQGGEAQNATYRYLENDSASNINDGFAASSNQITIDADAIGTDGYDALVAFTEEGRDSVVQVISKNGSEQLIPCTVALNENVQMQDGQINRVVATLSGNNRVVRYPAPAA